MEILQFLLNFLSGTDIVKNFTPIIDHLKENNFDLKKAIFSLTPEKIAPLINVFMSKNQNKNSPTEPVGQSLGFEPIKDIADSDIIYSLNKLLSV